MTSIANLSSAPAALPALNIQTHGHKKGLHAQLIDESGNGAAPASAGATQGLFGRLLQSLEKVIGAQLGVAATRAATSAAAGAGASANSAAAAGAGISVKA